MPWSAEDSKRHNKSLNPTQRKAWAEIADKARASGKSDAASIRIANAAAPKAKRSRHYAENMRKYGPRKSSRKSGRS